MKRKGFTLIELIVVIAIIAVLAAIVAPSAFRAIDKGKVAATIGDFKSIKTAAMAYYADTGQWPANCSDGTGFVNNTSSTPSGWDGPYLEKWPAHDQWGGTYTYNTTTGFRNLTVSNVTYQDAGRVDIQVDGSTDLSNGTTTYNNGTSVMTMVLWQGFIRTKFRVSKAQLERNLWLSLFYYEISRFRDIIKAVIYANRRD